MVIIIGIIIYYYLNIIYDLTILKRVNKQQMAFKFVQKIIIRNESFLSVFVLRILAEYISKLVLFDGRLIWYPFHKIKGKSKVDFNQANFFVKANI